MEKSTWKTARKGKTGLFEERVSHSPQEHEGDDNPTEEHEDDSGVDQVGPKETEEADDDADGKVASLERERREEAETHESEMKIASLPEQHKKMVRRAGPKGQLWGSGNSPRSGNLQ